MNHSSTQVPFVLAAIIAVMIHSLIAEPNKADLVTMTSERQVLKSDTSAPKPALVRIEQ